MSFEYFEATPNLVSRNFYHYLVNRKRRRLTELAQPLTPRIRRNSAVIAHNPCLLNSIWILLICLCSCLAHSFAVASDQHALDDPYKFTPSPTTHCVIGRLRQCYDDEDCVENAGPQVPEVKVVITNKQNLTEDVVVHSTTRLSAPIDDDPTRSRDRNGTCTCRTVRRCKRNQQSTKTVPIAEKGRLADQRAKQQGGHLGWILGTLIGLTLVGGCGFAIYYYGIRYGMIRNIARQLGLTDNTQVEHQLLNRIPSSADDETELAI